MAAASPAAGVAAFQALPAGPLSPGKRVLVRYSGAGDFWHERLLLCRSLCNRWSILTRDDDIYVEDLGELEVAPLVGGLPPARVLGAMLHRFQEMGAGCSAHRPCRTREEWRAIFVEGITAAQLDRAGQADGGADLSAYDTHAQLASTVVEQGGWDAIMQEQPLGLPQTPEEAESEVVVSVSALSGDTLSTYRLPRSSPVLHVKRHVQADHEIGAFRQRLLLAKGGRQLEDHEVLATLSSLHRACGAELEPLALMLVRLDYAEADADATSRLLRAAEEGAAHDLQQLLSLPMWPDSGHVVHPDGATPLILAARNGHPEAVRLLLEAGADKDNVARNGFTPLFWASRYGHLEVARLLLEAGADKDKPLAVASRYGHLEVARLLLEAGADKDKANRSGLTPLLHASCSGRLEVVRLLLDAGADKDKANRDGATPLSFASCNGHLEVARLLAEAGV